MLPGVGSIVYATMWTNLWCSLSNFDSDVKKNVFMSILCSASRMLGGCSNSYQDCSIWHYWQAQKNSWSCWICQNPTTSAWT